MKYPQSIITIVITAVCFIASPVLLKSDKIETPKKQPIAQVVETEKPIKSIEQVKEVEPATESQIADHTVAIQPKVIATPANTYPSYLANLPLDAIIDEYGYYNRECVSYVAQKLVQSGRAAPMWWGNANKWYDRAVKASYGVGSEPVVGSVGVNNSGVYGHAVYVEKILGGGMIQISQYDGATGLYSVANVYANQFNYIYF